VKLWQMILYPTLQIMIGFALSRQYGWAWDTAFVLIATSILAVLTAVYILLQTLEQVLRAQGYEAQVNPPRQPVTVNVPDLNPKFALSLRPVQIDVERAFAHQVVVMAHYKDELNLTEKYWLGKHFGSPSRWQKLGGKSRAQFSEMIERFIVAGAFIRSNPNAKNSTPIINSEAVLMKIVRGYKV
jgi:hypothetical protein